MKLILQIPCYNEAAMLPLTLRELPRQVEGFTEVEILVIDDGSTDGTASVAQAHGAHHVLRLNGHQGLARAFLAGLLYAVELGADVVANTDADNQYQASCIPDLVRPILRGELDLVVGARPIAQIRHFSPLKRLLQRVGSLIIRSLAGTDVRDVPSGFRAITREAALRLNVFGHFTYTIETIIQASLSGLRIGSIPVQVNGPTRPSRLFRSNLSYVWRAAETVLSAFIIYRPVRLFGLLGGLCLLGSLGLALRYFLFMWGGEGRGHIQSVILLAVFALSGLFLLGAGTLAHLLSINRRLLEEIRFTILRGQHMKVVPSLPPKLVPLGGKSDPAREVSNLSTPWPEAEGDGQRRQAQPQVAR